MHEVLDEGLYVGKDDVAQRDDLRHEHVGLRVFLVRIEGFDFHAFLAGVGNGDDLEEFFAHRHEGHAVHGQHGFDGLLGFFLRKPAALERDFGAEVALDNECAPGPFAVEFDGLLERCVFKAERHERFAVLCPGCRGQQGGDQKELNCCFHRVSRKAESIADLKFFTTSLSPSLRAVHFVHW